MEEKMNRITRKLEFDAGHRVVGHESKCNNVHGHRYVAEITVEALELDDIGRVIDFSVVKAVVGGWIDEHWDHGYIASSDDALADAIGRNGKLYVMPNAQNPTAECMVVELAKQAQRLLLDYSLTVTHVRLYETPNCWADWSYS